MRQFLWAFWVCAALSAPAAALDCPGNPVSVTAEDPALEGATCALAGSAVRALAVCNIPLTRPVEIRVLDALPEPCIGLYHCGEDTISLLTPEAFTQVRSKDNIWAALPDHPYYASVLIHELTHAAFEAAPCPDHGCPATSEYLAYAMQLRYLTAAERALVMQDAYAGRAIADDEINAVFALIAPGHFARKAWLHFSQRADPCSTVAQIMAGDLHFDQGEP